MTEQELFSKETFIGLLSKDEFDRINEEDRLFLEARKLGLEKRFKESLKKYMTLRRDKISLDNTLDLPKCKALFPALVSPVCRECFACWCEDKRNNMNRQSYIQYNCFLFLHEI